MILRKVKLYLIESTVCSDKMGHPWTSNFSSYFSWICLCDCSFRCSHQCHRNEQNRSTNIHVNKRTVKYGSNYEVRGYSPIILLKLLSTGCARKLLESVLTNLHLRGCEVWFSFLIAAYERGWLWKVQHYDNSKHNKDCYMLAS